MKILSYIIFKTYLILSCKYVLLNLFVNSTVIHNVDELLKDQKIKNEGQVNKIKEKEKKQGKLCSLISSLIRKKKEEVNEINDKNNKNLLSKNSLIEPKEINSLKPEILTVSNQETGDLKKYDKNINNLELDADILLKSIKPIKTPELTITHGVNDSQDIIKPLFKEFKLPNSHEKIESNKIQGYYISQELLKAAKLIIAPVTPELILGSESSVFSNKKEFSSNVLEDTEVSGLRAQVKSTDSYELETCDVDQNKTFSVYNTCSQEVEYEAQEEIIYDLSQTLIKLLEIAEKYSFINSQSLKIHEEFDSKEERVSINNQDMPEKKVPESQKLQEIKYESKPIKSQETSQVDDEYGLIEDQKVSELRKETEKQRNEEQEYEEQKDSESTEYQEIQQVDDKSGLNEDQQVSELRKETEKQRNEEQEYEEQKDSESTEYQEIQQVGDKSGLNEDQQVSELRIETEKQEIEQEFEKQKQSEPSKDQEIQQVIESDEIIETYDLHEERKENNKRKLYKESEITLYQEVPETIKKPEFLDYQEIPEKLERTRIALNTENEELPEVKSNLKSLKTSENIHGSESTIMQDFNDGTKWIFKQDSYNTQEKKIVKVNIPIFNKPVSTILTPDAKTKIESISISEKKLTENNQILLEVEETEKEKNEVKKKSKPKIANNLIYKFASENDFLVSKESFRSSHKKESIVSPSYILESEQNFSDDSISIMEDSLHSQNPDIKTIRIRYYNDNPSLKIRETRSAKKDSNTIKCNPIKKNNKEKRVNNSKSLWEKMMENKLLSIFIFFFVSFTCGISLYFVILKKIS